MISLSHFTSVSKIDFRGITAVSVYYTQATKQISNHVETKIKQKRTYHSFTFFKEANRSTVNASAWTAPQSKSTCSRIQIRIQNAQRKQSTLQQKQTNKHLTNLQPRRVNIRRVNKIRSCRDDMDIVTCQNQVPHNLRSTTITSHNLNLQNHLNKQTNNKPRQREWRDRSHDQWRSKRKRDVCLKRKSDRHCLSSFSAAKLSCWC